jgi:hypothetical protein
MKFAKSSKMEFLEIGSPHIPANVEIKKRNVLVPVLIVIGIGVLTYYKLNIDSNESKF